MSSSEKIVISIAKMQSDINDALRFCGQSYDKYYSSHWLVPSDLMLIAKKNNKIIATGGLTFAGNHENIASENYYSLSSNMVAFINQDRSKFAEFGRFASNTAIAAKAILHAAITLCADKGIQFLFAWANPSIYAHTRDKLTVNFWPIEAPLNLQFALSDTRWSTRPIGFFDRSDPPALHMGVIPFWENANTRLAGDCVKQVSIETFDSDMKSNSELELT